MQQIVERKIEVTIDILPGDRVRHRDAARLLGIHSRTLVNWARRGRLSRIRLGGRVFYRYGEIVALLRGAETS